MSKGYNKINPFWEQFKESCATPFGRCKHCGEAIELDDGTVNLRFFDHGIEVWHTECPPGTWIECPVCQGTEGTKEDGEWVGCGACDGYGGYMT